MSLDFWTDSVRAFAGGRPAPRRPGGLARILPAQARAAADLVEIALQRAFELFEFSLAPDRPGVTHAIGRPVIVVGQIVAVVRLAAIGLAPVGPFGHGGCERGGGVLGGAGWGPQT